MGVREVAPALVLLNARVLTQDGARPLADAVAVAGGRVRALGADAVAAARAQAPARVVDLQGATVTPGLVDAHTHPTLSLAATRGCDLNGCRDLVEVERCLRADAARAEDDGWVLGWGLDPSVFGTAPLTGAVLDRVAPDRPALVHLFDGHAALANRAALRRAGVTGARRFASTAAVVVDDDGVPTGLLAEPDAVALVTAVLPVEPSAVRLDRLADLLARMAATGLTGGHVMDCSDDTLDLVAALEQAHRLPLRLRIAPWCGPGDVPAGPVRPASLAALLGTQGDGGRLWEVAGVKLFLDGTVDGGTAWLDRPDCLGASRASYWPDPARYAEVVGALHRAGVPTATHAIGDAAVRFALDVLAAQPPVSGLRHRIEHLETLPDDQVDRFARSGVAASMQPTHATDHVRADASDNWSRRLGPTRAGRGWRCADVLRTGAVLALGSDWPVAPFDPRLTLAAAQTRRPARRPARRPDLAPVQPEQALPAAEALWAHTVGPAAATARDDRIGRVVVGQRADLTVWADDPTRVGAVDLPDLPVLATVVDGVVRHDRLPG